MANKIYKDKIGQGIDQVTPPATQADHVPQFGQVEGMLHNGREVKSITTATYNFVLGDEKKYIAFQNTGLVTIPANVFKATDVFKGGADTSANLEFKYDLLDSSLALIFPPVNSSRKLKKNGSFEITMISPTGGLLTGDVIEFEQRVTANIATSYAIDWNAGSQFVLTPTAAVTLSNTNLPVAPNTKVISGVFKASSFAVTFPASWKARANNDPLSATLDTHFTAETISDTVILYTLENIPA